MHFRMFSMLSLLYPLSLPVMHHCICIISIVDQFLFVLLPATICSPLGSLIMANECFQALSLIYLHRPKTQNMSLLFLLLWLFLLPYLSSSLSQHTAAASLRLNLPHHLPSCQLNTHKYYIHVEGMQNWNIQVLTYLAGSVPGPG